MDRRAAALAAVSGAALAVAGYIMLHPPSRAHAYAQAIAAGEARLRDLTPDDAEDDDVNADANEDGYRWAERNGVDSIAQCPTGPAAYRAGCIDYINERSSGPQ